MGTPDFAVPSLDALVAAGYPVVGVVTATDKLGGRGGKQLLESAVKRAALGHGIPVLQPEKFRDADFQRALRELRPDLQVVVAFRMLPESVWGLPPLGTFNLHGSLLPKYRGAAPINWAVINGDTETGCTTFFIRHAIDTGDVLLRHRLPIGPDETAGELHDRMMVAGAELVVDTVRLIESGDYRPERQDDSLATPAPKLYRHNCRIDWSRPVAEVHNFVRGLSPWPAAWTMLNNAQLKVVRGAVLTESTAPAAPPPRPAPAAPPGTVLTDDGSFLHVVCGDGGVLAVEQLQLAGKRRMATADFLRGTALPPGLVLV